MPRIQPLTLESATGKSKEILEDVNKQMGKVPNILGTMAQSPAVVQSYLSFSGALKEGLLSAALRERIALLVGQANNCEYCVSAHTTIGKMSGLSEQDTLDSRQGKASDAKEQAALDFAKAIVDKKGFVDDSDLETVRKAGYTDGEIAEITANVALNFFTNYFNHVTDPEIDFPKAANL